MSDASKPHLYMPDYQAMGDCQICGHERDKPWHDTRSSEPIRHSACPRSRRKALHQAEVICEELEFLLLEFEKRLTNLRYAYSKARKLKNRLRAKEPS